MKYVLDSSVALKWVLPEADSHKAIHLRDEARSAGNGLLILDNWRTPSRRGGVLPVSRIRGKTLPNGETLGL